MAHSMFGIEPLSKPVLTSLWESIEWYSPEFFFFRTLDVNIQDIVIDIIIFSFEAILAWEPTS